MYGRYANIGGILMVNVTVYGIHTDPMGLIAILIYINVAILEYLNGYYQSMLVI